MGAAPAAGAAKLASSVVATDSFPGHEEADVHFGSGVITRIQTYASSSFFNRPHPLIELDRHGNSVWQETGYDLATSLAAAEVFLRTPRGRYFADHEATSAAVGRLHTKLANLRSRL